MPVPQYNQPTPAEYYPRDTSYTSSATSSVASSQAAADLNRHTRNPANVHRPVERVPSASGSSQSSNHHYRPAQIPNPPRPSSNSQIDTRRPVHPVSRDGDRPLLSSKPNSPTPKDVLPLMRHPGSKQHPNSADPTPLRSGEYKTGAPAVNTSQTGAPLRASANNYVPSAHSSSVNIPHKVQPENRYSQLVTGSSDTPLSTHSSPLSKSNIPTSTNSRTSNNVHPSSRPVGSVNRVPSSSQGSLVGDRYRPTSNNSRENPIRTSNNAYPASQGSQNQARPASNNSRDAPVRASNNAYPASQGSQNVIRPASNNSRENPVRASNNAYPGSQESQNVVRPASNNSRENPVRASNNATPPPKGPEPGPSASNNSRDAPFGPIMPSRFPRIPECYPPHE
ncbi:hypothetical protein ADEAN_000776800 [Angomonas deanei]|uniref:Uncharacterized protein n=1 Tax=Angomonas deanei TaxID=59799 RepID=A0A7G2CNY0_9TRYP|nr:hypothetical protein ADEAN_000776800 [Angomonas deanei]